MARVSLKKIQTTTNDVVSKLWKECRTLQSAGVSYHNYVTELTFLLFLKMLEETNQLERLPRGYCWSELVSREGTNQLSYYKKLLSDLGNHKKSIDQVILAIFKDSKTQIRIPKDLQLLITAIDKLDWFSAREDGLGDVYEGLLEKTTSATKTKAGQYFTARPLIDSIVSLVKPEKGEKIQDPASGTGGFLIAADRYIKDQTNNLKDLTESEVAFQKQEAFTGLEWVQDTHRLCLMNLILHGIYGPIGCADTLSPAGDALNQADLVLTNPPFNKMTSIVNRDSFTLTATERVGPMPFVEHVVRALKPGGRAAIVVPDSILFGGGTGSALRTWLMELCELHTVLRLPSGIFYAQGVQTNVLFFTRGTSDYGNTKFTWFYDMRTNMPAFGKTSPLTRKHFFEFEKCFGDNKLGHSKRKDQGELGRFRCFTREDIAQRADNLDISWLKVQTDFSENLLTEPEDIAAAIIGHLRTALDEIESLVDDLDLYSSVEAV